MWFFEEHDGGMLYFDIMATESKGIFDGAICALDVVVGAGVGLEMTFKKIHPRPLQ